MRIMLIPTDISAAPQNIPPYTPSPMYQDIPASTRIQEVQLTEDLLQQGEQQDEYQEAQAQAQHYDDYYGEENLDFNCLSFSKHQYPYSCINHNILLNPTMNLIPTRTIQKFTFLSSGKQAVLAIDSGCEGNCIRLDEVRRLDLDIIPLEPDDLVPNQADGKSPLHTLGSVICTFQRNGLQLKFHGYVVKQLSQPILCGLPFMAANDITQYINKGIMVVQGKTFLEDPPLNPGNKLPTQIQQTSKEQVSEMLSNIEIGTEVPKGIQERLNRIHVAHKQVFDGDLTLGYNGAGGDFDVDFEFVNDLPPPPHKGSLPPYYKHGEEAVLQAKIEELERQNIVAKV